MLLLLGRAVNVTPEPLDLAAGDDWTLPTLTERRLLRLSRGRTRRRFRKLLDAPIVVLDLARLFRW